MLSALKCAEDGDGIVMRLWNTTSEKQDVSIATTLPIKTVTNIRLDETPISEVSLKSGNIQFEMDPHNICTLLFK